MRVSPDRTPRSSGRNSRCLEPENVGLVRISRVVIVFKGLRCLGVFGVQTVEG